MTRGCAHFAAALAALLPLADYREATRTLHGERHFLPCRGDGHLGWRPIEMSMRMIARVVCVLASASFEHGFAGVACKA